MNAECHLILISSFYCAVLGPEADRLHPGSAEPAGECHQADAQSHRYSQPAPERGRPTVHHCTTSYRPNMHANRFHPGPNLHGANIW